MKKSFLVFVVALMSLSHLAQAQTAVATAFAFERFMVVAKGSGWTTGANAAGQTVAMGPAVLTKAYAAAGAATVTPLAAGGATVGLSVGGGAAGAVAVASEAVLTGASVFGLFKAIMGGPVGLGVTALMVAPAVIDWLNQKRVRPAPEAATHGKPFEIRCAGVCVEYIMAFGSISTGYQPSLSAATSSMLSMLSNPESKIAFQSCASSTCTYSVQPLPIGAPYNISVNYSTRNVGGSFLPATIEQIRAEMESIPVKKALIDALLQAAQDGHEPKPSLPLTSPKNVTVSPSSVSDGSVVTVTKADGKTTTKTETRTTTLTPGTGVDAQGRPVPTVTATTRVDTTVKVVDDATGAVLSESTTVTGTPTKPAEPAPEIETCGLPGKPKCLIDETGTPEKQEEQKYQPKIDDLKTKQAELKDKAAGKEDKGFFDNWSQFFVTPPFVACKPYVLPRDMGSLDACGVVEGVRTVMAFAWALMAMVSSLGMIKRVV